MTPTRIGTIRRIQALIAIGYTEPQIAQACGVRTNRINEILNEPYVIPQDHVIIAVANAYNRMQMTPGTNQRSITRARNNMWAVPFAWDEEQWEEVDDETPPTRSRHYIEDTEAWPNSTGRCGTEQGRMWHRKQQETYCAKCIEWYANAMRKNRGRKRMEKAA